MGLEGVWETEAKAGAAAGAQVPGQSRLDVPGSSGGGGGGVGSSRHCALSERWGRWQSLWASEAETGGWAPPARCFRSQGMHVRVQTPTNQTAEDSC